MYCDLPMIIALWGWFCRVVLPVTCCEHGPPSIALNFIFMWIKQRKKSISERAIIGFDHGLPCRVKNMALGPQIRQKPRPSASLFVYWVPRAMFSHGMGDHDQILQYSRCGIQISAKADYCSLAFQTEGVLFSLRLSVCLTVRPPANFNLSTR